MATVDPKDLKAFAELGQAFQTSPLSFGPPCRELNALSELVKDKGVMERLKTPRAVVKFKIPFHLPRCKIPGIYVHPNYLKIREARQKLVAKYHEDEEPLMFHLTAKEGVGKSFYLLFDLMSTMVEKANDPNFKMVLVDGGEKRGHSDGKAYVYSCSTGWYQFRDVTLAARLNYGCEWDPHRYYFMDSYEMGSPSCHTVIVSPPNVSAHSMKPPAFKCEKHFLPTWEFDEVVDAMEKLGKLGLLPAQI